MKTCARRARTAVWAICLASPTCPSRLRSEITAPAFRLAGVKLPLSEAIASLRGLSSDAPPWCSGAPLRGQDDAWRKQTMGRDDVGLRRAGAQEFIALGLLARAALHTYTRAFSLARKDLDEALTLATRCGFRLHEADAHLAYARLSLAEGAPASARPHLTAARKLIEATGYHRRDRDLAELDRRLA
jgi:hypothetical protein